MDSYSFKRCLVSVFLLFSVYANALASGCDTSNRTRLKTVRINVPKILRHDQSIGQTKLVLQSKSSGKVLWSEVYGGNWFCLGYNKDIKTYIVGGVYEVGSWLPLRRIEYIKEDSGSIDDSSFDRAHFLAFTAVSSPNSHYIAFVGSDESGGNHLYVLDIKRDKISLLAPAPAPPPSQFCDDNEPFAWGSCFGDAYEKIEPRIMQFITDNRLQVSYGADIGKARAKNRRIRVYRLGVADKVKN